jgi:RNA polymerase sigma-70 factor (ECF subfamily)
MLTAPPFLTTICGGNTPVHPSPEAGDLDALRAGDSQALRRFVCEHSTLLYRGIFRLVRDPDETENLMQETYFQALRSLPSFRGESRVSTWLYGIAMNVTLAFLRKQRRTKVLDAEEMERLPAGSVPVGQEAALPFQNPQEVVERQELVRLVREAVQQLPDTYRDIITLRDLEAHSTEEVAARLGISEINVRVRLHRARQALRDLLHPYLRAPVTMQPV